MSRPSSIAGLGWYPALRFHLRDRFGLFRIIRAQLDTGAVISLLRRSMADLLGVDLTSCRPVSFGRFGHGELDAYVHECELRLDVHDTVQAPLAIAVRDDVPSLLGRAGIFDRFEFLLDPVGRQTRIRGTLP